MLGGQRGENMEGRKKGGVKEIKKERFRWRDLEKEEERVELEGEKGE